MSMFGIFFQGCARILLDEGTRQKYLKKMRNPKMDELQKIQFLKESIIKKCNKAVKCPRCGYSNGIFYALFE